MIDPIVKLNLIFQNLLDFFRLISQNFSTQVEIVQYDGLEASDKITRREDDVYIPGNTQFACVPPPPPDIRRPISFIR